MEQKSIMEMKNIVRAFPVEGAEPFYALKGVDAYIPRSGFTVLKGRVLMKCLHFPIRLPLLLCRDLCGVSLLYSRGCHRERGNKLSFQNRLFGIHFLLG